MDIKTVIEGIISMNDPKYINILHTISHICKEKADVLVNMQMVQNSYNAAVASNEKCNSKLRELIEM